MGLREAIITTVILGLTTAAGADTKKPRAKPAAAKPADTQLEADAKPADAADAKSADANAAEPAEQVPPHLVGPKHVDLGNNTSLDLPDGMWMFEREVAEKSLREQGNFSKGVVGIAFIPHGNWRVVFDYADSGYIEDSDADELDAGDLLDSYQKGTVEQNKTRKAQGIPELTLDGWSDKPHYERAAHHLIWAVAGHDSDGKVVNSFTRILGRNGFISFNLIADPAHLDAAKAESLPLLKGTQFNPGFAYADHVTTDRSSGIGLRGLIVGGAGLAVASKLGLLAKILLLFKKGLFLIFAPIAALFRKVFRRNEKVAPPQSPSNFAAPPQQPPSAWPQQQAPMGQPPMGQPPMSQQPPMGQPPMGQQPQLGQQPEMQQPQAWGQPPTGWPPRDPNDGSR